MTTFRLLVLAPLIALAPACDEATSRPASPVGSEAPEVTPREVTLPFPTIPPLARHAATAAVTALADDDGLGVAATAASLFAFEGTALSSVAVVADPGEPLTTGPVRAFARRDGGLLVSAEGGLYHTFDGVLLASPASPALFGATALSIALDGEHEVVWAALPDGLHRLDARAHERIVFPDEPAAPTAVAALPDAVLVAFGDRLYELAPDSLEYRLVPAALGAVELAVAAADRLFAGGPGGLLERRADGTYLHYATLGPVLALATDASGIPYARIAEGVLRLDPIGPVGFASSPDLTTSYVGLALDRDGHTWLGDGATLLRLATGRVVSFAADVAPILDARCGSCHRDGEGAPRRDFADYDLALALSEAIFTRISTGLMPPPPSPTLTADEYDLLVRWYAGDRAP